MNRVMGIQGRIDIRVETNSFFSPNEFEFLLSLQTPCVRCLSSRVMPYSVDRTSRR